MNLPYGPILVVEDVPNILELLEVTLKFRGYPVITASNGDEALQRLAEEQPSLILTDILMPRLDGFAFAHRVRRDPKTRDIPIIFISATFMSPEDRDFALSLGAVRFLEKPIESEELLLTVAEVLTDAPRQPASSLSDPEFYRGYSRRLEAKLREKHSQVVRARRLVDSVDDQQRSTFVRLLAQTEAQRDEIERELKALRDLLDDEA